MNLGQMMDLLNSFVRDRLLAIDFAQMLNDSILELAADFEFPALKLVEPVPLSVDSSKWLWQLPDSFHKKLFEVRNSSVTPWGHVGICDHIEELNRINAAHDRIGDHVTRVAVADQKNVNYLGIYPLPQNMEILQLWYYRKPTLLQKVGDVPDCFPTEFHRRVIIPKCLIQNFQQFTDAIEDGPMKSLGYWENEYHKGLYGERGGDIGLINFLAKKRGGPKRHGGRDPIGPGRYYRGYY